MADDPQEPEAPEPAPSAGPPFLPRRRQPLGDRLKGNRALEDRMARLADQVSDLNERFSEPDEPADSDSSEVSRHPLRARRFSRSGTVNGEEGLRELLQGGKPDASTPPGAQAPVTSSDTGRADAPSASPMAPESAPRSTGVEPPARRVPTVPLAFHKQRLKLLIIGSELLGLTLLALGFGMGWLIFSGSGSTESTATKGSQADVPASRASSGTNLPPTADDRALASVNTALKADHDGDLDRTNRLYDEMQRHDLSLRGLNYQLGLIAVRRGDLNEADLRLVRSIHEGENVAASYYVRSTFSAQTGDYGRAAASFEAAARAEPFSVRPFFFWGECLRRNGKPLAAIERFDEALARPCEPGDAAYIRFKRDLARIEAGNEADFASEILSKIGQPDPEGNWLLLAAAADITIGNFPAAADHLRRASQALPPEEFASKVADYLFQAQRERPVLAAIFPAIKTDDTPAVNKSGNADQHDKPGPEGSEKPRVPFIDPVARTIQNADPGNWPAPRMVIPK